MPFQVRRAPWRSFATCLAFALPPLAWAQGSAANPLPPAPKTVQTNPSAHPSEPGLTIQTRVPLTILDVVVTDSKGRPVHGLLQSDFTIFEDKQPVQPNSFEEHRADQLSAAQPAPGKPDLPPNTFANQTPAPAQATPLDILLFDPLNISAGDQRIIRTRMLEFIDRIPAGTRVAVFNLYAHLFILQGFTTDHALLKAAIEQRKAPPTLSPLEDPWQDPINRDPAIDIEKPYQIVDKQGDAAAYRAQYEIAGLNQLARYLSGVPGRKNLIWFSGSFPMQFPPFPDDTAFPPPPGTTIRSQSYDFEPQMKATCDLLARAHVAVYPIDGRGLEALSVKSVQSSSSDNDVFEQRNRNFVNIGEHFTMDAIAEQTGGKAFYNTNGFVAAAAQAVQLGSNFYTIAYTPANQALDTRFRAITVKVDRPGVNLVYRNGYYAVDPGTSLSGVKVGRPSAFQSAMLHGAPDLTDLAFKVKIVPSAATELALLDDNRRNASEMKPPYRRYSLAYTARVDRIGFTRGADGNYTADFEFEAIVISAGTGNVLNSTSREVRPVVSEATYQSMLQDGAIAHQEIDVPAKGEFYLRLGVHDLNSDRVGATEIPVSSIHPEPAPSTP